MPAVDTFAFALYEGYESSFMECSRNFYARRRNEDVKYNRAAMAVMRRHPEIQINGLNRVVRESAVFDTCRQGNDVHFKGEEQVVLGRTDAVIKVLDSSRAAERRE